MKLLYLNTKGYIEHDLEITEQSEPRKRKGSEREDKNSAQLEIETDLKTTKTRLYVGERHFYVSPAKLSRHSDYFQSMFTEFSEKKMKKVEIEVPFPEYFNDLLYFLKKGPDDTKLVTNINIIGLLCNADFLQASSLVSHFMEIIVKNWRVIGKIGLKENLSNIPIHLMGQIIDRIQCTQSEKAAFSFLLAERNADQLFEFMELKLGKIQFENFQNEDWLVAKKSPVMLQKFGGLDFLIRKAGPRICTKCHRFS